MSKNKIQYIRGFDGLRAISILLVILTHLGVYDKIQDNVFLKRNWYLFTGSTGVMIFFSISGFLITSLLLREKESFGRINFKLFFIRRFLRLLPPLLLLFFSVVLLMAFHLLPENYIAVLISFFYLYNFVPFGYYVGEIGHTWSLGVEEQFYFLWPFVISRIRKIKYGIVFATVVIIACLLFRVISSYPVYFNGSPHYLKNYSFIDRWFIPACLPIMVGSMTSMFLFSYKSQLQKFIHRNYLFLAVPLFFYTAQSYIPFWSHYFSFLFMPVGVSLFLLWIYFNQTSSVVAMLELRPVAFLGKISYGVYVYQGLFLRTGPGGNLSIQHFPLNIILLFCTAILSYYLIEKKILKYKTRFTPVPNEPVVREKYEADTIVNV